MYNYCNLIRNYVYLLSNKVSSFINNNYINKSIITKRKVSY